MGMGAGQQARCHTSGDGTGVEGAATMARPACDLGEVPDDPIQGAPGGCPARRHRSGECLSSRPQPRAPVPPDLDRIAGVAAARSTSLRDVDAPEHGCPGAAVGSSPTVTARRSAVAAASASAAERACTTASGRSGPTASPTPRTSVRPTAGSIASRGRRRPPPSRASARPIARASTRAITPARSGATASRTGASGEVSVGALDEIGRAAERGDHAREALGRGARGERALDPGDGLGVVAGQAAQDEQLAREGARHRVQPGSRRRPVRKSIASRDLERVAHVMAEGLAHVGEQRDDAEPRLAGDREQALGERGRALERRQQRAGADLDVHDEARRARPPASWRGSTP